LTQRDFDLFAGLGDCDTRCAAILVGEFLQFPDYGALALRISANESQADEVAAISPVVGGAEERPIQTGRADLKDILAAAEVAQVENRGELLGDLFTVLQSGAVWMIQKDLQNAPMELGMQQLAVAAGGYGGDFRLEFCCDS